MTWRRGAHEQLSTDGRDLTTSDDVIDIQTISLSFTLETLFTGVMSTCNDPEFLTLDASCAMVDRLNARTRNESAASAAE